MFRLNPEGLFSQPPLPSIPHLAPAASAAVPRNPDIPVLDQNPVVQADAAEQTEQRMLHWPSSAQMVALINLA